MKANTPYRFISATLSGFCRKANSKWFIPCLFLLGIVLSSCISLNTTLIVPPSIPGAEFVGSADCQECHKEISEKFHGATHFKLAGNGIGVPEMGCESCHGPGSIHSESGGMPNTIINPHRDPNTCFQCHQDVQASFHLPNSHPVMDGHVSCTDCHSPHEGSAINGGGMAIKTANQTCQECHTAQGSHYVFRHEATIEGCVVCHSPHGSLNEKMLKSTNASLCLQCHFQQQTATGEILIGGRNHASYLSRGTCWTGGCHEAVHGSNTSSSLRY